MNQFYFKFIILFFICTFNTVEYLYAQIAEKKDSSKDPVALSLDLKGCVMYAIDHNIDIKLETLNRDLKKLALQQSKNNVLPSIDGNVGYGVNFGRAIDPTSNQFSDTSSAFSSAGLSANLLLFNGFRLRNLKEQGKMALSSSEYTLQFRRDAIALKVVQAYFELVLSQELAKNAALKVENDQKTLERTKRLVEGGIQPKNTEVTAMSTLSSSQAQLIIANNTVSLNLLKLKHLMGLKSSDDLELIELEDEEIGPPAITAQTIYESALGVQKDILVANINEKIAKQSINVAKSGYYPSLSLNGALRSSYSGNNDKSRPLYGDTILTTQQIGVVQGTNQAVLTQRADREQIGTDADYSLFEQFNDNFNQSLSLNLSIPILNKRSTSNNVQKARVERRKAEMTVLVKEQELRQTIEQSYQETLGAHENYKAAKLNTQSLEAVYNIDNHKLEYGTIDFTTLEISKNNFFTARNTEIRRKFEVIFRTKLLELYVSPYTFEQ